jgi:hypothetical protein
MRADDLAGLLAKMPAPASGVRQAILTDWDPETGANTVILGGAELTNLPTLSASTLVLAAGDTVLLTKYNGTMYITGRVAPAGSGSLATRSASVLGDEESTTLTGYGDLATPGPSVDAYIGPSCQCIVIIQATIRITNGIAQSYPYITPAGQGSFFGPSSALVGFTGAPYQTMAAATATSLITAEHGLRPGLNNFKMLYARTSSLTGGSEAWFSQRTITVIPF